MSKPRINPFPGMNPYMEEDWPDIHTTLITECRRHIQRQLPEDLVAKVEQDLRVGAAEEKGKYRADIEIREPWSEDAGGVAVAASAQKVSITKPIILPTPRPRRRIAIMDSRGQLVTVIEILSPSNKQNGGLAKYARKRADFMDSGVNLVEIDLVRAGGLLTDLFDDAEVTSSMGEPPPAHVVAVFRGHDFDERALYPVRYQEHLPAFTIPLRAGEQDIVLDLQSVIQQCFEDAALWHTDYRQDPRPKLSDEDAAWLDGLLKSKGLR